MNREIMKIVNRVVSEEFSGRISNIKNRLFENKGSEMCESCGSGDMYEGECMECGNMYEGNTQELGDNNEEEGFPEWEKLKKQMDDRNSYKDMGGANDDKNNYRDLSAHNPYYGDDNDEEEGFPEWEKLKKQMDNRGELKEDVCEECGNTYEGNIQELGGMDDGHPRFGKKRLPNKMSIEDIENLLRGDDDETEDGDFGFESPFCKSCEGTGCEECDGSGMKRNHIGLEEDVCEDCGDTYERELDEKLYGNQSRIDRNKNNRIDREDFEALRSMKKEMEEMVYELDLEEDDVEEGNAFTGALSNAKKHHKDEFEVNGKKYDVKESKVYFTESEIIDIIENIVKEEKKKGKAPSAQNILKSTLGQSKKENEENIKRVAKKMKEYLKDGSKGKYDPNPKYFPKGNGEIEEMEKMAFSLTDDNENFNYEMAGLNIPVPDAIEFNNKRMDKYYEGSSETGNAPGGNAIESEANSRFNKMRKKQTLHRLKQQSYNKSPQPVFNEKSGQEKGKGIKIKLESTEDKKVISEMEKIKNLIGYNRKTQ